jgi:hypothetical protein
MLLAFSNDLKSSVVRLKKIASARLKHRGGNAYKTITFEDLLTVAVGLAETRLGTIVEVTAYVTFELLKTTNATRCCTFGPSCT